MEGYPSSVPLLMAFATAVESGRLDVAEHLLCAMECLCSDVVEGSTLEVAYRMICGNQFDTGARRQQSAPRNPVRDL